MSPPETRDPWEPDDDKIGISCAGRTFSGIYSPDFFQVVFAPVDYLSPEQSEEPEPKRKQNDSKA